MSKTQEDVPNETNHNEESSRITISIYLSSSKQNGIKDLNQQTFEIDIEESEVDGAQVKCIIILSFLIFSYLFVIFYISSFPSHSYSFLSF